MPWSYTYVCPGVAWHSVAWRGVWRAIRVWHVCLAYVGWWGAPLGDLLVHDVGHCVVLHPEAHLHLLQNDVELLTLVHIADGLHLQEGRTAPPMAAANPTGGPNRGLEPS